MKDVPRERLSGKFWGRAGGIWARRETTYPFCFVWLATFMSHYSNFEVSSAQTHTLFLDFYIR